MSAIEILRNGETLTFRSGAVDIGRYVAVPDTPEVESRKPFLHPMRTLRGDVVSAYRPWDHPWHKGLQMTWSEVSGQNFWGGKTYVDGEYVWLDNVGRMRHEGYDRVEIADGAAHVTQRLSWITAAGQTWITERRDLRLGIDAARGAWVLDVSIDLLNVRGEALDFGSPTTLGRPDAGYTGLFWRGPRSWTGGRVLAAGGHEGQELMGQESPWLAIAGRHDEVDGGATVVFVAGSSSACVPIRWFVRNEPYAVLNPSPAFSDIVHVDAGEHLRLRHRVAVLDRLWEPEELESYADKLVAGAAERGEQWPR